MRSLITLTSTAILASLVLPAAAVAGPSTVLVAQGHSSPGAVVQLYAWPSDHVLQELRHGQAVPRTLIATATASSQGAYSLRTTPAALSSVAFSGYANLEADSGTASWFFPYRTAANVLDSPADSASSVPIVNLAGRPAFCTGWVFIKQIGPDWAVVGQGYVTRSRIRQNFAYSAGQNSSLGIGLSQSGRAGTFTLDGTREQSADQTQGFPGRGKGNDWYRTKFRVAKYGTDCTGVGFVSYLVRSNGYAGGDSILHPRKPPTARRCEQELRGSTVSTHREKAVTWSAGFTIPTVNFNTSAETGYDSSAQLTYHWSRFGYECGSNNEQPGEAPQIVAKG